MCAHNANTFTQQTAKPNKNHVKQIESKDHEYQYTKYTHSVVSYKILHNRRTGKITSSEKTRVGVVVGLIPSGFIFGRPVP